MIYKIRSGIVMEHVCGTYFLVSTLEARAFCPYFKRLNPTAAFFWSLLEQGMDKEQMVREAAEHYYTSEDRVRPGLEAFLSSLIQTNYIIVQE